LAQQRKLAKPAKQVDRQLALSYVHDDDKKLSEQRLTQLLSLREDPSDVTEEEALDLICSGFEQYRQSIKAVYRAEIGALSDSSKAKDDFVLKFVEYFLLCCGYERFNEEAKLLATALCTYFSNLVDPVQGDNPFELND